MKEGRTWTDQELDTAFQEASAQQSAPAFQDAFWTEMEAMLPAKKNRKLFFWMGGAALTLLSLGIVGWTLFSTNTDSDLTNKTIHASKEPQRVVEHTNNQPVTTQLPVEQSSDVLPANSNGHFVKKSKAIIYSSGGQVVLPADWKPLIVEQKVNTIPVSGNNEELIALNAKSWNFTHPVTLNNTSDGKFKRSIPYYTELALGVGQSYRTVDGKSNIMPQVRLGLGLYSRVNGMELSAGLAVRAELPSNITSSATTMEEVNNVNTTVRKETQFKSLYSLEFPLAIGAVVNRHSFSAIMIPGVQLAYAGNTSRFEGSTLVRSERSGGSIPNSKTLTMEFGGRYMYSINENVQFTGSLSFDVIRPFQSPDYSGLSRNYPVSLFVGLRRTF